MAEAKGDLWKIRASVPTGLEITAAEECSEVLGKRPNTSRGCIEININSLDQLHLIDSLRSVDNINVVITEIQEFCVDKSSVLQRLEALPSSECSASWLNALKAWKFYNTNIMKKDKPLMDHDNKHQDVFNDDKDLPIASTCNTSEQDDCSTQSKKMKLDESEKESALEDVSSVESRNDHQLNNHEFQGHSFRVTCTRVGPKTCYSSVDAARVLGSGIVSCFNWSVDLRNPDIEVLLKLNEKGAVVAVALTREAKYKRNIVHFGPTTLRATIGYGLLRLGHPKAGDIVLDPLCGGGSISIEGFHGYPKTFHLCGDIHDQACKRAKDNVAGTNEVGVTESVPRGSRVDVVQWDVTNLPLRTASVDLIVTDMPFGKKMGSKAGNWDLYKRGLGECGRVCVPGTGRGIFMTHDTKAIAAAMKSSSLWQRYRTYWINLGGLKTGVHVLLRTKLKV